MRAFVRGLPKAELHVHIEGTLEPELMFELAARNAVSVPFADVEEVRAAYRFDDLQSFLDIYYRGASVLVTERDFTDLMLAYLERAAADGVRHAEVFFDPQTHTERGIDIGTVIEGLAAGRAEGQRRWGITTGLILCFLRHLSGGAAVETLRDALAHGQHLLGVGLDSAEVGNPPERFAEAFDLARVEGLHVVAHAGEEGPPAYVTGALDALGVERIDHGVRAEEDPVLLDRLVRDQVPLTVCPLSNRCLQVFPDLRDHNLGRLLARGVKVTVNSDDPAYFGGYVVDNYLAVADALGLSRHDLTRLARNSLEAAFLDDDRRTALLTELDGYVAGVALDG
ncbi:MAG: adenosine deaminase [Acidimicrobiales bacterium]|nr:adenosine deaminase [Acidimicrobiales bacterium]